jgi:4-hydroxy-2-oxoheptanedioate aldolase
MIKTVKTKLESHPSVFGVWSIIDSPSMVEIAALAGLDFQILDLEHGMFDTSTLKASILACEAHGCSPLVRLPSIVDNSVQKCLDLGVHGIIFPRVANYQDALTLIQSTQFPPRGDRGYNPFTAAQFYTPLSGKSKLQNDFPLVSLIIENKKAYQDLEKIASIPGLDMLYLGIYDMSVELGIAGQVNHPLIIDFISDAMQKIKKARKHVGVMAMLPQDVEKYITLGANFIAYGVDSYNYYRFIKNGVDHFNQIAGSYVR